MKQLLTPQKVCELYPVLNVNTLAYWRQIGCGPSWARLGKRIVYRQSDVDAWIEAQFAASAK